MDIYVINLERCPDRLEEFRNLNFPVAANFIRWPAADGTTLDPSLLIRQQRLDPNVLQHYTSGALGCAQSHLALWEHAVDTARAVTLCEDDVVFNIEFAAVAEQALARLPADWDLVMWGWNFDAHLMLRMLPGVSPCCATFDQDKMLAGMHIFQRQHVDFRLFPLLRSFGTPCYSISPKGAQVLYRHCLPLRPMQVFFPGLNCTFPNNGIDMMMNAAYPDMQAFVSFPPLVVVKNDHAASTVLPPDRGAAE
jgi:GR25 family glycosyltransferase involved in LPS biosynthesis